MIMRSTPLLAAAILSSALLSCASIDETNRSMPSGGFDRAELDKSVSPCDDFYTFATGGWQKRHPIPPAYPSWGSFNVLNESNITKLRGILEDASSSQESLAGEERKLADLYSSCMNEKEIERLGIDAIRLQLDRIDAIRSHADLQNAINWLQMNGIAPLFGFSASQDLKDTDTYSPETAQGGLGLPERAYYLEDDERSVEIRERYVEHVANMLKLSGYSRADAENAAGAIMRLETSLATASMPIDDARDPDNTYNPHDWSALASLTPDFSWKNLAKTLGMPDAPFIVVGMPDYFREMNRQLTATPIETWRHFLRWKVLDSTAASLSTDFVDADFAFYGAFLNGRKANFPRWRRCVSSTNALVPEILGKGYVKQYFPPESKRAVIEMIENMRGVMGEEIAQLEWMSPETKRQAIHKLNSYKLKIGYPDKWLSYEGLTIAPDDYAGNILRASAFETNRQLEKIGKPIDRSEWGLSPAMVNAFNDPQFNEIIFPAGILQPPFYDAAADNAYNYGGIGAVIGHELIHGFDDTGRKFDANGALRDWWTEDDGRQFEALASCVVEQFDSYDLGGGFHMNGKLVLGESIADLGALKMSYQTYMRNLDSDDRMVLDGFTPEQRFFLGWARVWANNSTPEFERLLATSDEHPIARSRVNGPMSNMHQFASAFQCEATDVMVRRDEFACSIW